MKFILATLALVATALAGATNHNGGGATCDSDQTVVCTGNGNGGLLTLGNVAPGLLGSSCAAGDVYCCKKTDVDNVRYPERLPCFTFN